jgi:hypothetical protein
MAHFLSASTGARPQSTQQPLSGTIKVSDKDTLPQLIAQFNKHTVATEKSIYQEYMERTLFHSELWGIFPIIFFQEADNKISTSPEIVHVNIPITIGKISMEK